MKELIFNLIQHTPMLHFQGNQPNATLRVSDVKPRFDRWLIDTKFAGNFDSCKKFMIGYNNEKELKDKFNAGFRSLNYKMKIVLQDNTNSKTALVSSCPMYFGKKIYTVCCNNIVSFIFPKTSEGLYDIVYKYFSEFINTHNFGTRSSKGYGSFTVENTSVVGSYGQSSVIGIDLDGKNWRDVLSSIDLFYKTIRSGINFTYTKSDKVKKCGYYFKSMLYSYVETKYSGKHWDKKVIKNHFLKQKSHDIVDDAKIDVRDYLGLSTSELWKKYNMSIKKSIDGISRFPSPITFKPVKKGKGWQVYMILSEIPNELKGREVIVKGKKAIKDKDARELIDNIESYSLKGMKMASDFSIEDYFNFLFANKPDNMNSSEWSNAVDVERRFHKYDESKNYEIKKIVEFYKKIRKVYLNRNK